MVAGSRHRIESGEGRLSSAANNAKRDEKAVRKETRKVASGAWMVRLTAFSTPSIVTRFIEQQSSSGFSAGLLS
jgi:hypothetical protein